MPGNDRRGSLGHGLDALKQLRQTPAPEAASGQVAQKKAGKRKKMLPPAGSTPEGQAHALSKATAPGNGHATGPGGTQSRPGQGVAPDTLPPAPAVPSVNIDPTEITLFRRAMASVRPMRKNNRAYVPPPPKPAPHILRERRERAAGAPLPAPAVVSDTYSPAQLEADDTRYVQNPASIDLIRQLERGRWVPMATLDLHGNTQEQARERLMRFLVSCVDHDIRCVRLIHGQGFGSRDGEPVLKNALRRWLTQLAMVQAFVQCRDDQGGAGAMDVLLKKPEA